MEGWKDAMVTYFVAVPCILLADRRDDARRGLGPFS